MKKRQNSNAILNTEQCCEQLQQTVKLQNCITGKQKKHTPTTVLTASSVTVTQVLSQVTSTNTINTTIITLTLILATTVFIRVLLIDMNCHLKHYKIQLQSLLLSDAQELHTVHQCQY